MKKLFILLLPLYFLSSMYAQETRYNKLLTGKWLSEDGDAIINIFEERGKVFGRIVWLKEPNNEAGHPKVDDKNPDPALQRRKILGLLIMKDFIYKKGLFWSDGSIYDPKSGKTYDANLELKEKDTLSLRGYVGVSLIGRSSVWHRVKN